MFDSQSVTEWVNNVGEKLAGVIEIVKGNEEKAIERMKAKYDKKAKLRVFEEGQLYLVRTPIQQKAR